MGSISINSALTWRAFWMHFIIILGLDELKGIVGGRCGKFMFEFVLLIKTEFKQFQEYCKSVERKNTEIF
jgi:hypothetical protein